MAGNIVTLTTDFGYSDHYVGAMKGAILNVNPEAKLVDISHDVRPYDVLEGAFAIAQVYQYFPPRARARPLLGTLASDAPHGTNFLESVLRA